MRPIYVITWQFIVPALFVVGIKQAFVFRTAFWIPAVSLLVGAIVSLQFSSDFPLRECWSLYVLPAAHVILYFLLKLVFFGSVNASHGFVMYDYRKNAGPSKDRFFGGCFLFGSLIIDVLVYKGQ